ncbi:MAG: Flp pilus assembly complex ATPase component TadA, partial [Planctomycetes bacterium]|nr:Flp pilus assembly complex ATPase component TadA [Planctomycetota bacterium]
MAQITECHNCGARYNTTDLKAGKRLRCKRCNSWLTVGQAVDIVDVIVQEAIRLNASDIHIEPLSDHLRVRYRIDGVLVPMRTLEKEMESKILSRIKVLAQVDIAERRRHQDGRFQITIDANEVDLRLSSYVTVHGENIVLRILNKKVGLVPLGELGLPPSLRVRYIDHVLESAAGVIVITGPTGSGKTTTLYSSIDYCNNDGVKIITAEDPVEY